MVVVLYVVSPVMYDSFWVYPFLHWVLEMVFFQSLLISECQLSGQVIPLGVSSPEIGRLRWIKEGLSLTHFVQLLLCDGCFMFCDGTAFVFYQFSSETSVAYLVFCLFVGFSGFAMLLVPFWYWRWQVVTL